MTIYSNHQVNVGVTLLAEGVDRNQIGAAQPMQLAKSPSSRRVWIEIMQASYFCGC